MEKKVEKWKFKIKVFFLPRLGQVCSRNSEPSESIGNSVFWSKSLALNAIHDVPSSVGISTHGLVDSACGVWNLGVLPTNCCGAESDNDRVGKRRPSQLHFFIKMYSWNFFCQYDTGVSKNKDKSKLSKISGEDLHAFFFQHWNSRRRKWFCIFQNSINRDSMLQIPFKSRQTKEKEVQSSQRHEKDTFCEID